MLGADRRKKVAAAPLTGVLGIFAVAATDLSWSPLSLPKTCELASTYQSPPFDRGSKK
jgi:hypothetical protein